MHPFYKKGFPTTSRRAITPPFPRRYFCHIQHSMMLTMMRSQSFLAMGEEQNVTWTTVKLGLLLLVAILLLQLQVHAVQDFSVTSPLSQTRTDNKSHSTASNEEEPFLLFHFVHTTSENTFTIRNLKAVESVFFHHPNASVIVHTKNMTSKPFQNLIRAGYNISTHPFDLEPIISELLRSAPINQTHARQFLQNIPAYSTTKFWYTNQSNLLRLALLYTQGGVYLDTDLIVVKPLDSLVNVAGLQQPSILNGAVLKFDKGNRFIASCLDEFFQNFNPEIWGHNGPKVLTRVAMQSSANFSQSDLTILEPPAFYPFYFSEMKDQCFLEMSSEKVQEYKRQIQKETYVVHMNNKKTSKVEPNKGSVCDWLYNSFCVISQN